MTAHRFAARFIAMVVVGLIVGAWVWLADTWELGLVTGWAAACLVFTSWVWLVIARMDATETAAHARREDPTRSAGEVLILAASVASLGAVAMLLIDARSGSVARSGVLAMTALASVALSWLLVHTLFTLRYASQYFDGPVRDIDFNTDEPPRYIDFAYVAFSVGMTFQISDTNLRTSALRAIVLRHALLSYLFGTVVVATTINLAINLAG